MNPSPSPPQEAEHIRHQSLTPESPRPQNVPSPANIPILEQQMDPGFHEPAPSHSTPSTATAHLAPPAVPPFPAGPAGSNAQNVGAQGAGGFAQGGIVQAMAYGAQDTSSIHNFSAQPQHDATQAPGQPLSSAYPYAHDHAYAAQQAPAQSAQGAHYQTEGHVAASVDVQALLDSLAPAATKPAPPSVHAHNSASATSLPSVAGLPPRPPAQDKPTTHPNYDPHDDIRSFHPHSQQAPGTQPRAGTGQPGSAQHQQMQRSDTPDDEDIRWPPEINRKYEAFLEQERKFVTEGQWDQFPIGSRLFIGNLPTEKVTKRDIFHRFYRHGALAQISIKQAYGFVQFLDAESCRRALDAEQGQAVRGRKMHLEVSKPQKNSRKADNQTSGPRRRSRSPDYTRGGTGPSSRDGRYNSGPISPRDRDRDRRFRDRDDYRPMRSPSPRGNPRGMRSRDRSRERYDARYRSRSRTPPRRRRSPSPRRDYTEDGLDLRRRLPHEVPDIQILVLNENLSRDFIRYVEDMFRRQNLRSNVLVMSGRFPEPAVVRRQILEGVLAIVRLDTSGFAKGKVSVQIFDRRGGANNVQFNEYADLDPTTAALLVNNAKHTQSQAVQPPAPDPTTSFNFNRNIPAFPQQPANPFPGSTNQPNISNIITSLDSASLSQLLGAMSGNSLTQPTQPTQPAPALNTDIARLLAQVSTPAQSPGYGAPAQPQLAQLSQFPGLASLFANPPQPAAPPVQNTTQSSSTPDMSDIMAQLAQYQRG